MFGNKLFNNLIMNLPNYKNFYIILYAIENPIFNRTKFVRNWERYVPEEFRTEWMQLNTITKTSLYIVCKQMADAEVYE